jgi:hypothetical protein
VLSRVRCALLQRNLLYPFSNPESPIPALIDFARFQVLGKPVRIRRCPRNGKQA